MRLGRNADVRLRSAARRGDRRAWLIERLRAGDLHPVQIALAASLGDPDARYIHEEIVDPEGEWIASEPFWFDSQTGVRHPLGPLNEVAYTLFGQPRRAARFFVAYAVDVAERLVPESRDYDSDSVRTIRAALETMRQWTLSKGSVRRPTRRLLPIVEPILNRWTQRDADMTDAIYGAFRAHDALSTSFVLLSALYANPGGEDAERRWQKLRLAQYALGEVM